MASASIRCCCHDSLKLHNAVMPVPIATSNEKMIAVRLIPKETNTGTEAASIIIGMLKA